MPRELVHWKVIQETIQDLSRHELPKVNACLKKYPLAAYLGAIAHDVPYYYRLGEDPFEAVADYLHGKEGEDTFVPMKVLAHQILHLPAERQEVLWAFFFGMLSHMATDIHFHPVVYYFTGNYHDPVPTERIRAQGRHRLFEVYLDSWVRPRCTFPFGFLLRDLLRQCSDIRDEICEILEKVLVPEIIWDVETRPGRRWYDGMSQLALFQYLFLSSTAGAAVRCISRFGSEKLKSIDSLLSFRRRKPHTFFDAPMEFQNPVSGENRKADVSTLLRQSVEDSINLIARFEAVLFASPETAAAALAGISTPSLNYGVANAPVESGKYFSINGAPLPGLVR
jgi:hypothetical protein